MNIQNLTQEDFKKQIGDYTSYPEKWEFKGNKPCLVDFYAPWCIHCKNLSPILEQLADEYAGKVDFYQVDVDQETELETAFHIRTIPNLLFCPLTGKSYQKPGTLGKGMLKQLIEELLQA